MLPIVFPPVFVFILLYHILHDCVYFFSIAPEIVLRNALKDIKRGEKLFVRNYDKTHLAMKRLQCFIAYYRKEFTENRITFHGLRHTYAHEKYNEFIGKVLELIDEIHFEKQMAR